MFLSSLRCDQLDGDPKEVSPIFTQFLECVWQLTEQFPQVYGSASVSTCFLCCLLCSLLAFNENPLLRHLNSASGSCCRFMSMSTHVSMETFLATIRDRGKSCSESNTHTHKWPVGYWMYVLLLSPVPRCFLVSRKTKGIIFLCIKEDSLPVTYSLELLVIK